MTAIDIVLVGGARDGEEMTIRASEWLVVPRLADVNLHAHLMQVGEADVVDGPPSFERDVYRRDALGLLAAHVKVARMRQRGVVGAYVEPGFLIIRVVVPVRNCKYCAARLAQANPGDLCQTCQQAGVRT